MKNRVFNFLLSCLFTISVNFLSSSSSLIFAEAENFALIPRRVAVPSQVVRLTIVNYSSYDVYMKLEGSSVTNSFYYLTVPAGSRDEPTVKVFTLMSDVYERTTWQCNGAKSTGTFEVKNNIRLTFTPCDELSTSTLTFTPIETSLPTSSTQTQTPYPGVIITIILPTTEPTTTITPTEQMQSNVTRTPSSTSLPLGPGIFTKQTSILLLTSIVLGSMLGSVWVLIILFSFPHIFIKLRRKSRKNKNYPSS
jgi:hypothetical protein